MRQVIKSLRDIFRPYTENEITGFRKSLEMHTQEHKVFKKSRSFLKKLGGGGGTFNDQLVRGYEWDMYNFQVLIELLERYHSEIGLSNELKIKLLGSFDSLILSQRFMMTGHYNATGKYLRTYIEMALKTTYMSLKGTKKKKSNSKMVKAIQKLSPLREFRDVGRPRFESKEFSSQLIKMHRYLSNNFAHTMGILEESIKYDEKQVLEHIALIRICIFFVSTILKMGFYNNIKKLWGRRMRKKAGDYADYSSYIMNLFVVDSYCYLMSEDKFSYLFIDKIELNPEELFDSSYFKR